MKFVFVILFYKKPRFHQDEEQGQKLDRDDRRWRANDEHEGLNGKIFVFRLF